MAAPVASTIMCCTVDFANCHDGFAGTGAPMGGVLAGTFAGRKNLPWEPVVPWELF